VKTKRPAELPNPPLEDALQLVHLYFERGSPKAEPAARRRLVRYLSEGTPSLRDVAKIRCCSSWASCGSRSANLAAGGRPRENVRTDSAADWGALLTAAGAGPPMSGR
jgi:hypothetical protein